MGVTIASDGTISGTLSSHTRTVQLRLMKEKNVDKGELLLLLLLVVFTVLFVIKFLLL